ncbi:NADPH-dependent FMN reductase [Streptomyces antimicrobicus]|uniref:NAD(P)H-dependent oxidoreductase n=1 Tax=Streptomyces antimicrobicus TaxID=2883108 RepID=A0ABS8BD07_9ACTN|nr:NADPH-dependent FMN reductase [Streptomyces antimicrobicus]MCB5182517.1 NAD(P)H-dependent oxidoreductase [Streptomyces antimicrobicus]
MPRLLVLSTSTRPTSAGRPLAHWVAGTARAHGGFSVVAADLAEIALPLLDEPEPAASGRYVHQHTRDWSATVSASDAVLFVMPLHNGGFSAPLKNAVDYLYHEWKDKPVGLLTYSAGPTGGAPAAQMLRPVLARLGIRTAERSPAVPGISTLVGEQGFTAPEGLADEVAALLDELAKLAAQEPTVSA